MKRPGGPHRLAEFVVGGIGADDSVSVRWLRKTSHIRPIGNPHENRCPGEAWLPPKVHQEMSLLERLRRPRRGTERFPLARSISLVSPVDAMPVVNHVPAACWRHAAQHQHIANGFF